MLQKGTHPHGNKRNIQKTNELKMEADPKIYQIEGGLTTNELNDFKTILTDIKCKKTKIFAGIYAHEMMGVLSKARALEPSTPL